MRIAFYIAKNGTWLDKLIATLTFSKYSHCELVFSSGEFGSSSERDGGVRLKMIDQDSRWDIFDVKNKDGTEITPEQEKTIHYWFLINDNQKYDWPGAIMSLFGVNWTSDDKKFCSYVCADMLGIDPIVTPQKLLENLIAFKMIDYNV
jgi:hypothetical protein